MSLQLAEQILELFRSTGATQVEQFAALGVVRELVPVSGSALVEPRDEMFVEGDKS